VVPVLEGFSSDGRIDPYFRRLTPGERYAADASHAVSAKLLEEQIRGEEESFLQTMSDGIDRIGEEIEELRRSGASEVPGRTAFRLYDTHGIPLDLITEIAADEGLAVDVAGFEREMEGQRKRSSAGAKFEARDVSVFDGLGLAGPHSEFRGYPEHDFVRLAGARVLAIVSGGRAVDALPEGGEGVAVADRTVFYPEGGGQVGDTGSWSWTGGSASVEDTQRPAPGLIAHRIRVERGTLRVGDAVEMEVPEWQRRRTQANHTGTHLLHAALRVVLGESARQMGSLVAPDRLRFDYAARAPLTPEQISEIERLVNEEILRDRPVAKEVLSREEADGRGAIAFFGEKYGDRVRVVTVPGFSTELCGGCHVPSTGEIGAFKILSDKGLAAGVRRIEAVTALGAVELLQQDERILAALVEQSHAEKEKLPEVLRAAEEKVRALEKEVAALRIRAAAGGAAAAVSDEAEEVDGVRVLTREARGLSPAELRNLSDALKGKLKSGVVAVGGAQDGKTAVIIAVTSDLLERLPANEIAARVGPALGGRGGGRRELAQVGGRDEALLKDGLAAVGAAVREILASRASRSVVS